MFCKIGKGSQESINTQQAAATWRRFFASGRKERKGSTAVTWQSRAQSQLVSSSPRHLWESWCAGGERWRGLPSTHGGSSRRGQSRTCVEGALKKKKCGHNATNAINATCARPCRLPGGTSCAHKMRRGLWQETILKKFASIYQSQIWIYQATILQAGQ